MPPKQDNYLYFSAKYNVTVMHPNPLAIHPNEGQNFIITTTPEPGKRISWRQKDLRKVLLEAYFSLPIAKIDTEGGFTDKWINIHCSGRSFCDYGVSDYGRNPDSLVAWAKPVDIREVPFQSLARFERKRQKEIDEKIRNTLQMYVPLWEEQLPRINLFTDKDSLKKSELTADEIEFFIKKMEKPLWANDKFVIVYVQKQHVNGMHLVIHPRASYWKERDEFKRAWQSVFEENNEPIHTIGFLEAFGMALAAERILLQKHMFLFHNPEIHCSGNWGLPQNGDPVFNQDLDEWDTSMHIHLYATSDPDSYVELPSRPELEAPDEWKHIKPINQKIISHVESIFNEELIPFIKTSCQGPCI